MHKVLIAGAGKVGSLIAVLLGLSKDYQVYLADVYIENPLLRRVLDKVPNVKRVRVDFENPAEIVLLLKKYSVNTILSALPYFCNAGVIKVATELNINYFDLTEDVATAKIAAEASQHITSAFVPQCGLAPGFISIVTQHLMKHFSALDTVKMRVGALPINSSNALQYSLTWSTDGLINEYGNRCQGIENGEEVLLLPLADVEEIKIDGLTYEAFNTSGGTGSLTQSYLGRVKSLSYKTIRYPGHCEKMRFLMHDLKLNYDRETLKRILEASLPQTMQDVVLIYVSVTGIKDNKFCEENYVKKIYPKIINGYEWSAIQLTTASSLCAVVDHVLTYPERYHGFVKQEEFNLDELIANRFGQIYA